MTAPPTTPPCPLPHNQRERRLDKLLIPLLDTTRVLLNPNKGQQTYHTSIFVSSPQMPVRWWEM